MWMPSNGLLVLQLPLGLTSGGFWKVTGELKGKVIRTFTTLDPSPVGWLQDGYVHSSSQGVPVYIVI